jgi:RNA polymerase sigma-70 factor, ECF subfamily
MTTDHELLRRIERGELEAFEEIVARYRDTVFGVAARVVGPVEADDVTQDTFLRAFNTLHQFRGDAAFKTWLTRIAHNTALNALARKRPIPVEEAELDREPGGERTPADVLESGERRERLMRKIGLLKPPYRSVVLLRDVQGLSYDEIAGILDVPLGTVKIRLRRARALLIDMLRNNTYDWDLPA